jgi:5-methyltetrahydrofolate--homocysteine methyltransferase
VKQFLRFEEAQNNKVKIDWNNFTPVVPTFTGAKQFNTVSDLEEIADSISIGNRFLLHGSCMVNSRLS